MPKARNARDMSQELRPTTRISRGRQDLTASGRWRSVSQGRIITILLGTRQPCWSPARRQSIEILLEGAARSSPENREREQRLIALPAHTDQGITGPSSSG